MRVALYVRVSTTDQTTLNQELILKEYCIKEKHDIFKIYKEEGVSGAKTTRPELDNMLKDMRARMFDAIIVWKLDRLGRSTQHLLQLLEEFKNKDVRLIIYDMNIDTGTPLGKLFFTISGAFAEMERELIKERSAAGQARAKSQGKHIGRPVGKKDSKPRRKSGYYQRWSNKK